MSTIQEILELTNEEMEDLDLTVRDFYIEPEAGGEYRLIHEYAIENIFFEEVVDIIKTSDTIDIPNYVEIDWQSTVDNIAMDGYGHHFSSYDGSEEYCSQTKFYIFRTN